MMEIEFFYYIKICVNLTKLKWIAAVKTKYSLTVFDNSTWTWTEQF